MVCVSDVGVGFMLDDYCGEKCGLGLIMVVECLFFVGGSFNVCSVFGDGIEVMLYVLFDLD